MEFTLPESDTLFVVKNHDGTVLLSIEIIELDILLRQSQEDLNKEQVMNNEWLPIYKSLLEEKMGYQISDTIAYMVAEKSADAFYALKKKCGFFQSLSLNSGFNH
jgi:hypothetical protein